MPSYGQFCPLAQASEILTERWTPLVLRELLGGPAGYNEIHRGVPLMSSSLLSTRLRSLERAGVIERESRPDGPGHRYRLSAAGEELAPLLTDLAEWGERWIRREVGPGEAEPHYLMWSIRNAVVIDELPPGRTVAHFRFPPKHGKLRYWWLVLERMGADLCLTDPGFGVDLTVATDPVSLARVFVGDLSLSTAMRAGELRLEGSRDARDAFTRWFGLIVTAGIERVGAVR